MYIYICMIFIHTRVKKQIIVDYQMITRVTYILMDRKKSVFFLFINYIIVISHLISSDLHAVRTVYNLKTISYHVHTRSSWLDKRMISERKSSRLRLYLCRYVADNNIYLHIMTYGLFVSLPSGHKSYDLVVYYIIFYDLGVDPNIVSFDVCDVFVRFSKIHTDLWHYRVWILEYRVHANVTVIATLNAVRRTINDRIVRTTRDLLGCESTQSSRYDSVQKLTSVLWLPAKICFSSFFFVLSLLFLCIILYVINVMYRFYTKVIRELNIKCCMRTLIDVMTLDRFLI